MKSGPENQRPMTSPRDDGTAIGPLGETSSAPTVRGPRETTRDHLTHVKDLDRFTGLYPIYLRLI